VANKHKSQNGQGFNAAKVFFNLLGLHKIGKGYKLSPPPLYVCETNWLNPTISLSKKVNFLAFSLVTEEAHFLSIAL
jgi:hypothetical protein